MKRIFVFLLPFLLLLTVTNLSAQIRKIPAAVTEAFKTKYPQAKNVEWKDRLTFFQASFELDGAAHHARFNNKGEWDQTEKEISQSDLPEAVNEGFDKSKYSDWEVSSVAWIQYKDEHIEYRVLVKRSNLEKKYLYFNENGKLLRDSITL